MKALMTLAVMLLLQGSFERGQEVDAAPQRFHLQRALRVPAGARGQTCAVLDAAVYEHAEGRMGALRLYQTNDQQADAAPIAEVPFALTESGEAGQEPEAAKAVNIGSQGAAIVFDLLMPHRTYTAVNLSLSGHNFYATAKVSGSDGQGGPRTELGSFALFDLTGGGLARSTTLPLQEESFPQLHVELTVTPAPGGDSATLGPAMVGDARVPPSREAQTLYTTVAETNAIAQQKKLSVATLHVPAHVPVERVRFTLDPAFHRDFLREVSISAATDGAPPNTAPEVAAGEIERVDRTAASIDIHSEHLVIDAIIASNLQKAATLNVSVHNGDDAPLALRFVTLEMRERKLCFEAQNGAKYVLRYGDSENVRPPVYDYARLFRASNTATGATLAAEVANPAYHEEVRHLAYTERHPELLWVALLAVVAVLGVVALRSARRAGNR